MSKVDMTAHHTGKTQRLELLNDTRVNELFSETRRDFGDWILDPKCALIHWTTAEYDSPVEDVLRSEVQTALRYSQPGMLYNSSYTNGTHLLLLNGFWSYMA